MKPSSSLTQQKDMAALQERIARAAMERDTWQASGMQEKYLEAYSMVEALERQLDGLRQGRPSGARVIAGTRDDGVDVGALLEQQYAAQNSKS